MITRFIPYNQLLLHTVHSLEKDLLEQSIQCMGEDLKMPVYFQSIAEVPIENATYNDVIEVLKTYHKPYFHLRVEEELYYVSGVITLVMMFTPSKYANIRMQCDCDFKGHVREMELCVTKGDNTHREEVYRSGSMGEIEGEFYRLCYLRNIEEHNRLTTGLKIGCYHSDSHMVIYMDERYDHNSHTEMPGVHSSVITMYTLDIIYELIDERVLCNRPVSKTYSIYDFGFNAADMDRSEKLRWVFVYIASIVKGYCISVEFLGEDDEYVTVSILLPQIV